MPALLFVVSDFKESTLVSVTEVAVTEVGVFEVE